MHIYGWYPADFKVWFECLDRVVLWLLPSINFQRAYIVYMSSRLGILACMPQYYHGATQLRSVSKYTIGVVSGSALTNSVTR